MIQRRPTGAQGDGSQPFDMRTLLFVMLALTTWTMFFSPAPPVAPVEDAAAQADDAPDAPAPGVVAAAPAADDRDEPATPPSDDPAAPKTPAAAPRHATLGSVDPEGPHRMLVTLTNVGAAVERVELSSEQYRELDDRSGYLGHLALTAAPGGGSVVNVVGPGTPAEAAGFRVGDVITDASVEGLKIKFAEFRASPEQIRKLLAATKPGREQSFTVLRDGKQQTVTAELRRRPLSLLRPEIENILLHTPEPPDDFESRPSFLVRLHKVNGRDADDPVVRAANERLERSPWAVAAAGDGAVVFSQTLPDLGLEVVKRFTLAPSRDAAAEGEGEAAPAYHFGVEVEVRNTGADSQSVSYELTGPNGLPIEGFWYATKIGRSFGSYGLRDIVVRHADDRYKQFACSSVAEGDVTTLGQDTPLAFVGVDAQYFASIVMPEKSSLRERRIRATSAELATTELGERARDMWENPSCLLVREPAVLEPGATLADGYTVFAGPKLPSLLERYRACGEADYALDNLLYYGWFGPVARVMLGILHFFYAAVGNYGVAIVLLTVVVRGALFPLSRQQAQSMVKMQELKPEIDRIAERYKDDMQKRNQAQQELFRKHNYNPAAGCLPMLLQLPIFLGLYRALAVDVELRQAPLLGDTIRFCSNLAAPDMLLDWSAYTPLWMDNGEGMLGLGPFFNLLPMFSVCLFLLQQKMFMPEPTNEQARLQQKLMKYMMMFMGLLLFKMPSGLCIYFIASSLWGICERKLLPKPAPAAGADPTPTPAKRPDPKPSSNGEAARRKAKRKKTGGKKRR